MATSPYEASGLAASLNPAESGAVSIGRRKLYWESYGPPQAPAAFLLHHGLGSTRSWRRQVPILTGCGWRAIAYDRWGYGRSTRRPSFSSEYLLEDSTDALTLLDALEIDRAAWIGHSDGGTIALLAAFHRPGRVAALVLIAAHMYYETRTRRGLETILSGIDEEPLVSALAREHGRKGRRLAQAWLQRGLHPASAGFNLSHILPAIRCPTLVVQGEMDEHATERQARDIAAGIAGAQVWLIPGVGHMPLREAEEAFNRRLVQFLEPIRLADRAAEVNDV
jgi:pimeloyl-ACP methyl ester carboxylesterase